MVLAIPVCPTLRCFSASTRTVQLGSPFSATWSSFRSHAAITSSRKVVESIIVLSCVEVPGLDRDHRVESSPCLGGSLLPQPSPSQLEVKSGNVELFTVTLMEMKHLVVCTYSSFAHTKHLLSVSTLELGEVGGS